MKKKRILIVNCYFDVTRFAVQRNTNVPQAMAPAFLAGVFSSRHCDIKIYNEQYFGHLQNRRLLAWPHMLVLTGLSVAFDRMLHVTAYARSLNPKVVVVAGGSAIRAIPRFAERFFDYCCIGDVEAIKDVIEDVFGLRYVSRAFLKNQWALPRYDLLPWMGSRASYVESSRNCYYACSFCSISAEGGDYRTYELEHIHRQFLALGRRKTIVLFIDNNFASIDKAFLQKRFTLLSRLKAEKYFLAWAALVSSEFFLGDVNLKNARDSGCVLLFSGVEAFDSEALLGFNKYQNTGQHQIALIEKCLNAGIAFNYGLVFDPATRMVANMRAELDFFLNTPEIPLPCYISFAAPLLGTSYFYDCLTHNRFLPNVKLRDIDDTTIVVKCADRMDRCVEFIKDLQYLTGYRLKVLKHAKAFYRHYRSRLPAFQMLLCLNPALMLCTPRLSLSSRPEIMAVNLLQCLKKQKRTFVGSTEPLDRAYTPAFRIESRYARYFQPTMLTDAGGNLNEDLQTDLLCAHDSGRFDSGGNAKQSRHKK